MTERSLLTLVNILQQDKILMLNLDTKILEKSKISCENTTTVMTQVMKRIYGSVMTGMEKTEHRMKWLMSITIW